MKLKPMIQARAKERQKEAGENFGKGAKVEQKSAQAKNRTPQARDELAKIAGVSHDTF